jgi:uncharacterized protein YbjQ (UPF0145 family)
MIKLTPMRGIASREYFSTVLKKKLEKFNNAVNANEKDIKDFNHTYSELLTDARNMTIQEITKKAQKLNKKKIEPVHARVELIKTSDNLMSLCLTECNLQINVLIKNKQVRTEKIRQYHIDNNISTKFLNGTINSDNVIRKITGEAQDIQSATSGDSFRLNPDQADQANAKLSEIINHIIF